MRRNTSRAPLVLLLACALTASACSSGDGGSPADAQAGGQGGTGGRGGSAGGATGTGGSGTTGGSGMTTGGAGGGGAGGGAQDAPVTDLGGETAAGPPKLCGEIRNCIVKCTTPACAQACFDQAPAAARTKFQAVTTCSKMGCAEDDKNCRCDRECLEPGACVPVVDECREGVEEDTFCDELCH
jgi:hypothetical protein